MSRSRPHDQDLENCQPLIDHYGPTCKQYCFVSSAGEATPQRKLRILSTQEAYYNFLISPTGRAETGREMLRATGWMLSAIVWMLRAI
eukprot:1143668-Prorocentrum_minimum.AAC.1